MNVMKLNDILSGDEDKIAQALAKLCAEDLTLKVVNDGENSQSLIYGIGDRHIDMLVQKLNEKYKVEKYKKTK